MGSLERAYRGSMDSTAWDERYASADLVWSATPNRWVEQVAADFAPGRALDLAAGEGRNALWLVERGWEATAVDFSAVALDRARSLAEQRFGANAGRLRTVPADLLDYGPDAQAYDLVLVIYLQVVAEPRRAVLRAAASAVAPGGHLLVVAHDSANLTDGVGGPQDPDLLFTAADAARDIAGTGLEVARTEKALRPVEVDGVTRHAIDALLLARRPGSSAERRRRQRPAMTRAATGLGPRIAVTGATGQIGGRVARRLADAGAAQRLVVRTPARAPQLPGADVVGASYGDAPAMRRALAGIDVLFLVSASESADRVVQHRAAVDAAADVGVRRIVYLSYVGAAPDCVFTFGRDHWATEQHIRARGLSFTFLRDDLYADLVPSFAGPDGAIRGPAGDGRAAMVARDDVADVAVAVLVGDGQDGRGRDGQDRHDGATYDVTGPQALSMQDVADELTRVSGRTVTYVDETVEEAYASRAKYGAPDWEVAGWVSSYQGIASGEWAGVTSTVADLTGHPAATFAEVLRRHPSSYQHLLPAGS